MSEESEESEPAVELGDADPVEGAPIARVASRLTWGIERSELARKEGDTVVRTPEGPRELREILETVDATYFDSQQSFERAIREVVGTGPVR